MSKKALLIVDVQNDFCPGGALAVTEGDKVVPVINRVMKQFRLVIASKDWHPAETVHFKKWPVHCVSYTSGAEFHPELDEKKVKQVFFKGTKNKDDGYSAFEATNENLYSYLKKQKITDLYVCGLATDYCVRASVLDALKYGFKVFVISDAVKGVNLQKDDVEKACREMAKAGARFISSREIE